MEKNERAASAATPSAAPARRQTGEPVKRNTKWVQNVYLNTKSDYKN